MKIESVNPEILKWAREKSNVTENKIIGLMGNDNFILWENGDDYPTFVQLEKLMFLYKFPVAISFFPEPPEYDDSKINFRTIPKTVIDNIDYRIVRLFNKAKSYQINLYELDKIDEYKLNTNIIKLFNSLGSIDEKIDVLNSLPNNIVDLRKKIRKPKDLFDFWRDELFEHGIFVFKDSFGDESISGFSIYDESYPIIYINNSLSFTRQVFTLFHELFHLFSNTNGIDFTSDEFLEEFDYDLETEYLCNSFSGRFLVPTTEIIDFTNEKIITFDYIGELSNKFLVSRDVILRRLFDLKIVSYDFYMEFKNSFYQDNIRPKINIENDFYFVLAIL